MNLYPPWDNSLGRVMIIAADRVSANTDALQAIGGGTGRALYSTTASELIGTFTWRVVAKRKGVTAPRLAKYDLPKELPRTPLPILQEPRPPKT